MLVYLGRFVSVIVCIICLLIWLIIAIEEREKKPLCFLVFAKVCHSPRGCLSSYGWSLYVACS